jgi:hypothetical protein
MKGLRSIIGISLLTLATCSGRTIYRVHIDALSFIPENQLSVISAVPEGIGLTLYILPEVHLDLTASGPDEKTGRGLKVSAPLPPSPPEEVDLTLEVKGLLSIENLDTSFSIPSTRFDLFIADSEAVNIYMEGTSVLTIVDPTLNPLETRLVSFNQRVTPADNTYHLIETGVFRIGIRVDIAPAVGKTVDIRYTLDQIDVDVSGRPFGYIP